MNLLITGGSGFIGESILARLLVNSQFKTIYVLIRPKKRRSLEKRIHELIQKITPPENIPESAKRIKAIAGNFAYPKIGMSERDYEELINSVNQILHNGAITNLGAPIENLRETNVEGTRNVLELAEASKNRGFLKRFDYVSTAFVGGINKGEFKEDDLVCGQSFANTYEQSKYEAELLLNKYRTNFPITIYRPSIVVGDSKTGYSPNFNLFWFMKYIVESGTRYVIPYSSRSKLDIVPVDFVADSIVALMQSKESLGETFHLTAGRGNEIKFYKIARDAVEIMQLKNHLMIPLWVFNFIMKMPLKYTLPKKFRDIIDLAAPYQGYFEGKSVSFNSEKTKKVLMNYGIAVPDWDSYKHKILNYCIETQWGKLHKQPLYMYYCHLNGTKGFIKDNVIK